MNRMMCVAMMLWGISAGCERIKGPGVEQAMDGGMEMGLAARYPGDRGIGDDGAVIFASGFEDGMEGWRRSRDVSEVMEDEAGAHGGERYLKITATRGRDTGGEVSHRFDGVDELYLRFYCRFDEETVMPHHFVKIRALTDGARMIAGQKPGGDEAFWTGIEPGEDMTWHFYTYWYKMHSWENADGRPNVEPDGSGRSFYGNLFHPAGQASSERGKWICVEVRMKANTVGRSDGELTFWIDGVKKGDYRPGSVEGTWYGDRYVTHGARNTNPQPFEGFEFRSDEGVKMNQVALQWYVSSAYYGRGRVAEHKVYFDDVVIATKYIGPRVEADQ